MQKFTLEFTQEEINVLGSALSEMPFKVVASLINSLNAQLSTQQPQEAPTFDDVDAA